MERDTLYLQRETGPERERERESPGALTRLHAREKDRERERENKNTQRFNICSLPFRSEIHRTSPPRKPVKAGGPQCPGAHRGAQLAPYAWEKNKRKHVSVFARVDTLMTQTAARRSYMRICIYSAYRRIPMHIMYIAWIIKSNNTIHYCIIKIIHLV